MFNRKILLITVVAAVALVAIVLVMIMANQPALAGAANQPPRAAVTPANEPPALLASTTIQVLGTIVSPNQGSVTFKGSGRITELRVQEGAMVKKGDTLALLDTTELQLAVQQAQAALAGAQARLNQVKSPGTDADVAAARTALDAAQKNYDKIRAGPSVNDLAPLKAQADNAKAAVDQAQAAYDRIGGASNPFIAMTPQSAALQQAMNNYKGAVAAFNNAATHPTPAELAAAQGQVEQAQAALARLSPTADNVAAAQAQVDQANVALALAQQHLANATLTAPLEGIVIWLGPHVGETVAPTTAIATLADLSHLQLQGSIDQVLLEQIQVGQTATIIPDAFRDKTVTGKVSRIGWLATSNAGVTNLPVTIDVDPSAVPLRPGLSATAQIQIQNQ